MLDLRPVEVEKIELVFKKSRNMRVIIYEKTSKLEMTLDYGFIWLILIQISRFPPETSKNTLWYNTPLYTNPARPPAYLRKFWIFSPLPRLPIPHCFSLPGFAQLFQASSDFVDSRWFRLLLNDLAVLIDYTKLASLFIIPIAMKPPVSLDSEFTYP